MLFDSLKGNHFNEAIATAPWLWGTREPGQCGVDGSCKEGPGWVGIFKSQGALFQIVSHRIEQFHYYQIGLRGGAQAQA
jgi:hypothetical protein